MKRKRIGCWWMLLTLAVGLPALALAAEPGAELHLDMGGKLGIGTDSISINQGVPSFFNSVGSTYPSLGLTYWLSGRSALQILGFVNFYSYPSADFSGKTIYDSNQTWGFGAGYKYNLREPFKGLFVQLLGRVTYAQANGTQHQTSRSDINYSETLGMFGGIGFEFFLPFWEALSLEANVGYMVSANDGWTLTHYNPLYSSSPDLNQPYNYSRGGIISNGFTINTLSINIYF